MPNNCRCVHTVVPDLKKQSKLAEEQNYGKNNAIKQKNKDPSKSSIFQSNFLLYIKRSLLNRTVTGTVVQTQACDITEFFGHYNLTYMCLGISMFKQLRINYLLTLGITGI